MGEVLSYLPHLARKISVAEEMLRFTLELLPLTVHGKEVYQNQMAEARRRIGKRDPNDVDLLALVLALGYPLWSNDRDFEGTGVALFTTASLLKSLPSKGS